MPENSPTVRQRRLGSEIKKARKGAGFTLEQAAGALNIAHTTLGRWESAETRLPAARVAELLGLYGGTEAYRLALEEIARKVRTRGWWASYSDVLAPSFAELEDDASAIRIWQAQLIPGLLQTPAYARALISVDVTDEAEINRRLQAREHRKAILARSDAPSLEVVLDEAVLRRAVGGREVMHGQLAALLKLGERPNVSIRVLPFECGGYPFIGNGSVMIFGFAREIYADVAYVESFAGGLFVEAPDQVRDCSEKVSEISDESLSEEESAAQIRAITKE